jgi:hypothetical protein
LNSAIARIQNSKEANSMKSRIYICITLLFLMIAIPSFTRGTWVSLQGDWRFALDTGNDGINKEWFRSNLADSIKLPGTTDEFRKGKENDARELGRLTRLFPFHGPAWYQRDITVPEAWAGKRISLMLERTKNSRLWVDDTAVGTQESLVAPHVYALGSLTPGTHRLTLRINNAEHPPVGDPHQFSDQTQTDWNGVIGSIGLTVTDPVWIEDIQVYPDAAGRQVRMRIEIGNATGKPATGTLTLSKALSMSAKSASPQIVNFTAQKERTIIETNYKLGNAMRTWDEWSPNLFHFSVALKVGKGASDHKNLTIGIREFNGKGTQFQINGKTTFLRGRHDACVFPLTGYPPMNVEGWRRVFKISRSYGLNFHRFHTWCPPEAAFQAADELGVYLQPELPNWKEFGDPAHDAFLRAEGERLLRAFGNHPSFVMLALGNELGGRQDLMAPFIRQFHVLDPRHLYAQGSNNWFQKPDLEDDYYCAFQYNNRHIRGSYAAVDTPLGHIQAGPANTLKDYTGEIVGAVVPVVSSEVGQFEVAPDLREIPKYSGVVRARNFEAFRTKLAEHDLIDQADDFVRASGALSVLCYREDIEAALRTRFFGGFHLLDLQDFPGQGTAIVGILDAFLNSKGLIEPAKWREFCSESVPLIRMAKFVWATNETFTANAEIAHYGAREIQSAAPVWRLLDATGQVRASGKLATRVVPQGALTELGSISIPLERVPAPGKFSLALSLKDTSLRTTYDLWIYPAAANTNPGPVAISRVMNEKARQVLADGGKVLLLPELTTLTHSTTGTFASDFWNYGMFKKLSDERKMPVAPGTLGILCDPKHPALSQFPTESHSNWQWFNLLQNSRALVLDMLPKGYRPIVQVIDNYERAHKLGTILEAKVGTGKLLICAIDLPGLQDKPEARQLLSSLLAYMDSQKFDPQTSISEEMIEGILK